MGTSINILRHKTAIRRYAHSKPVALALGHGLIGPGVSVFDFGCGFGEDVRLLADAGVQADGWDPFHRPGVPLRPADCVNLGYVLNVIEDADERAETLRKAFDLARSLLIVSVRVDQALDGAPSYADGYLTNHGSFQKIYTQAEFREYLNSALGRRPYIAGLGVAYIFKTEEAEGSYLARQAIRPRRERVDIAGMFAADGLAVELLDRTRALGRLPLQSEFPHYDELQERFGPLGRIERLVAAVIDRDTLVDTQKQRREDILTYIAMMRLRGLKPPPFRRLPYETQADIKSLWPSYKGALDEANTFLFSMGKPELVRAGCTQASVGKLLPEDLYVHKSVEDRLPPLLRVILFAARQIVGDVDYDVVKVSTDGRKVSFLRYPGFEEEAHPALEYSLRVYLPTISFSMRDYRDSQNPPILHRKETLVDPLHPAFGVFAGLSRAEEDCGLLSRSDIGHRRGWQEALREVRVRIDGHSVVRMD
jgi:DNA phosphorothioation-associated putative methyltransferase